MTVPIRVGLIDDHALIREGLRRSFEREPDFEVVAEGATFSEGEQIIAESALDVLMVDLRLPDGHGLGLVRSARAQHPEMGIVVLTMYAGDQQLFDALEAGASAFVPKSAPAEDIVAAARHAAAAPQSFTAADLADAMQRRFSSDRPQLSPREREVLGLLADGLSVAQISRQLFISDSTTKTHISKLYEKLGAGNRAQALMSALRLGFLDGANPEDGPGAKP
jgi:DNA-binding NarL/FixJ family response regulator